MFRSFARNFTKGVLRSKPLSVPIQAQTPSQTPQNPIKTITRQQSTTSRRLTNHNKNANINSHWSQRPNHHSIPQLPKIKVNPLLTHIPAEPQLAMSNGKSITLADLSKYREQSVKRQIAIYNHNQHISHHSTTQSLSKSRQVMFPMARTLATSAKSMMGAGAGLIAYHALLSFVIWSRYTYSTLETYYPDLLSVENITFTKLIMLVDYCLKAGKASLNYYVPTVYDLYYLLHQSLYIPYQRYKLRYILQSMNDEENTPGKMSRGGDLDHNGKGQQNGGQNGPVKYSQIYRYHLDRSEQLQQIMTQNKYRRLSRRNLKGGREVNNGNGVGGSQFHFTGNKVEDVLAVQSYCLQNTQQVEYLISELEKLYYGGCETIYMASFENMKQLQKEVEMKRQLYQFLLSQNPQNPPNPSENAHNGQDFSYNGQNLSQDAQNDLDNVLGSGDSDGLGAYPLTYPLSLSQYLNKPRMSNKSGPISVDNRYLTNCHIYDQLEGISSGFGQRGLDGDDGVGGKKGNGTGKRLLSSLAFDFTTSQTARLENNVQDYIYNVYHHLVDQLPMFKTNQTFGMSQNGQNGTNSSQNQPSNVSLFWDFNIASYYDVSAHNQTKEQLENGKQGQDLGYSSHRQLESASLSIHNNNKELSHTTINAHTIQLLGSDNNNSKLMQTQGQQGLLSEQQSSEQRSQPQLEPSTLMSYFPLPDHLQSLISDTLTTQLHTHPTPPQLTDLLFAANFNNNNNKSDLNNEDSISLRNDGLKRLGEKKLSPVPTMEAFSLENRIKLQEYLKSTIQDLKRIVIHQYDTHQREIVPEVVMELQREIFRRQQQYEEQKVQQKQSSSSSTSSIPAITFPPLTLQTLLKSPYLASRYSQSELAAMEAEIERYYNESMAHLTYNIALFEESQNMVQKLTSFLSPHYIIAHPLYFSLFAKNQYSPHLGRSVDRFVFNLNQDGIVSIGQVPTPYITELNHFDTHYTADAFIASCGVDVDAEGVDLTKSNITSVITQTATQYIRSSSLLSQYKRAQMLDVNKFKGNNVKQQQKQQQQQQHIQPIQQQKPESLHHQQQPRSISIQSEIFNLGQEAVDVIQQQFPASFDV